MNKIRLERLLNEHHKDAFLWASQCCNYNREEGKEVLQMTYLKILEGKAAYAEHSAFKTWLFSVIRFTAIDHLKKRFQFEGLEKLQAEEEEEQAEPDPVNYKTLLSRLPDRQHQVLLLAFYHDMTLAMIAEVMGLHIGTVRTHYERGKIALREIIVKEKYDNPR
jgi:RNA polymerase sigma factor (sigma-70 family)